MFQTEIKFDAWFKYLLLFLVLTLKLKGPRVLSDSFNIPSLFSLRQTLCKHLLNFSLRVSRLPSSSRRSSDLHVKLCRLSAAFLFFNCATAKKKRNQTNKLPTTEQRRLITAKIRCAPTFHKSV